MKNRKAQMDALANLGVGIAILCITLMIAFLVMDQGKEQVMDVTTSASVTNGTYTVTLEGWTTLNAQCVEERDMSITELMNCSTQGGVNCIDIVDFNTNNRNYSIDGNSLNISNNWGLLNSETIYNASFTCVPKSMGFNATTTLQNATQGVPGWVPLIVIAMIGVVLLGLVSLFRRR